jgi:hypothetical protein
VYNLHEDVLLCDHRLTSLVTSQPLIGISMYNLRGGRLTLWCTQCSSIPSEGAMGRKEGYIIGIYSCGGTWRDAEAALIRRVAQTANITHGIASTPSLHANACSSRLYD